MTLDSRAEELIRTLRITRAVDMSAILAALTSVRDAERARCVGIARGRAEKLNKQCAVRKRAEQYTLATSLRDASAEAFIIAAAIEATEDAK